jgi:hypothetical protein
MAALTAGAPITAEITYTVDTGEKLINGTFGPATAARLNTGTYERRPMPITDGRAVAGLGLETSGFALVEHPTKVTDFFDPAQLESVYYAEVVELVKRASGAARVVVFDHTLRSGDETERGAKRLRELVLSAHNDYTEWSGPQRVRDVLPDEAETLLARRFAIIQVWRAIDRPIVANPLALADARSVAPRDLLVAERHHPGRIGQTYRLQYNPGHAWFYFPRMRRDEAIVFKVFDSERDGRARFTPHTSFEDPSTPAGAPPRQSIEVRTLAFF